jgi:hypothetical protein
MRSLKSGSLSSLVSGISNQSRFPMTEGDRHEIGSVRHPALPRHLHPNYQHWQWLNRPNE